MGNFHERRVYEIWLIAIRDVSPPFIEVVLGTEFSDHDRRTGDNKTRPKNWCRQFARKVGPRTNSVR